MTLARLRAFDAVVRAGGISAGARELGVRQPTVSAQLSALEQQYDVRLVDRTSGTPTPLGERLGALTRPLFELEHAALAMLEVAATGRLGRLRVGADAPVNVMPLLAQARRRSPELEIEVRDGSSGEVLSWLRGGVVDVAVAADVGDDPALSRLRLREQQLAAVVRTDHPSASGKTMTLAALAQETLVIREAGSAGRRAVERAAEGAGLSLRSATTVHGREAAIAAVVAGLGVAVIPEDEMLEDPRLVMLDLTRPAVAVTEYLVWRRGEETSAILRELIEDARRVPGATA